MATVHWKKQNNILELSGVLEKNGLHVIWCEREQLFNDIHAVDLSTLTTIDSAGLALLVNCCLTFKVKCIGISLQVATLIKLYNLETVMEDHDK